MSRIIFTVIFSLLSCVYSDEYGILSARASDGVHFFRQGIGNDGNPSGAPQQDTSAYAQLQNVTLNEGDKLEILSVDDHVQTALFQYYIAVENPVNEFVYFIDDNGPRGTFMQMAVLSGYNYVPLESRTIYGPCVIVGIRNSGGYDFQYRIIRASNESSNFKYSASLNSEGDRLAIAEQNGTNSFTRVYEFNGTSWTQLGEDIQ
jgi:hypothetical protein